MPRHARTPSAPAAAAVTATTGQKPSQASTADKPGAALPHSLCLINADSSNFISGLAQRQRARAVASLGLLWTVDTVLQGVLRCSCTCMAACAFLLNSCCREYLRCVLCSCLRHLLRPFSPADREPDWHRHIIAVNATCHFGLLPSHVLVHTVFTEFLSQFVRA